VALVLVGLDVVGGSGVPRVRSVALGAGGAVAFEPDVRPVVLTSVSTSKHPRATSTPAPGVHLFGGLGSWVDIYEHTSFAHPERAVHRMRVHGVRTLYIETSNFRRKVPIKWPHRQARFIRAAHAEGLEIVAWYLPGFVDPDLDYARVMKAIRFRTKSGERFDGFALDIESPEVRRAAVRTRRLLQLSTRIRSTVGAGYPLAAIIPTPLGMRQNPTYWPWFPYRRLDRLYDAFEPMTYFTWRTSGWAGAHRYTIACIDIIRRSVRDRGVPIHVIGGISDESTRAEARGFVHAVRQRHVLGASYYAFHGTTNRLWEVLRGIP
jgi:hypothetical protein